jgi:hypothetical protein
MQVVHPASDGLIRQIAAVLALHRYSRQLAERADGDVLVDRLAEHAVILSVTGHDGSHVLSGLQVHQHPVSIPSALTARPARPRLPS